MVSCELALSSSIFGKTVARTAILIRATPAITPQTGTTGEGPPLKRLKLFHIINI